jgi:predicted Rossmann fold flavoprotein
VTERVDIVVAGAGAAGLMAAIWAGRTAHAQGLPLRIIALDGAKLLGAKILVAGGGRCNVTHDHVDERSFFGSTRPAIRNVLRRFDVPETIEFFRELGVTLKREDTGKLFPTTDRARTVLDALLNAARDAGVEIRHPWRVDSITPSRSRLSGPDHEFTVRSTTNEDITAPRIILATGGKSLPKTGSDGHGYSIVRALGHTMTPRILPALVPLTVARDHFLRKLSGLAADATVEVRSGTGKRLIAFTGPVLCTHFGLSGPAILDISRHLTHARLDDLWTQLIINWMPAMSAQELDELLLQRTNRSTASRLQQHLPVRLARALCANAGVDPSIPPHQLKRDDRLKLLRTLTEMDVPVTGDRGFIHAEVTAGGVPLSEIKLETMESRVCPGLHLCGEICDVDGQIGGYNFQWAWASGFVAGSAAAHM